MNTAKQKILFVGLSTVDLQFLVDTYPGSNTKTKASKNDVYVGGPATNAAITASFLGSEVCLASPVGKHSFTSFITEDVGKYNVTLTDPIKGVEADPIFASIITSELNGDRTIFSYHPPKTDVHSLAEHVPVDGYNLALFDGFYPEIAVPIAKKCKAKGIITVFDGGSWKKHLPLLLPYIDIAICSNDFYPPACQTKQDVFGFLKNLGIPKMAITQGSNEILVSESNENYSLPIACTKVIDTLGAGDIVHGAFCHFFVQNENFKWALEKASGVASFSCKYFGTREWMKEYHI